MKMILLLGILFFFGHSDAFSLSNKTTHPKQLNESNTERKRQHDKLAKRIKRKVEKMQKKKNYYQDNTAIFILGFILSAAGFIFLFFDGGPLSLVLGFFGTLLCFLVWKSDEDVQLPFIGVLLGVIGILFGIKQFISSFD